MRTRPPAVLAGMTLFVVALAACGGDDSSAPADTAAPTTDVSTTETPSTDAPAPDGGGVAVLIEGFAFATNPVAAGGPIAVVNNDSATHTVTADDGSFDVRVDGQSSTVLTETLAPGAYSFHCEIHPSMTGELTVN